MKRHRTIKFVIVGITLTLINFAIYTFLARIVMSTNELLWLDSLISYFLTTFAAFLLHSKITWKERRPTEFGVIKFFLWNFLTALLISPFFAWFFKQITPLYESVFNLTSAIHLPLDYNFIESTGVFVLTTCITMILNFLFYDKLVFGKETEIKSAPLATNEKNKVSVIIPIYNTEKYLKPCLDSIINQSYHNLEIILVDDGSTDDSSKITDEYAKKDSRIKVIHQKNQGQSVARNQGLKKATGDFISFIDSDDKIAKDFVAKLLAPYENKNTALTVCGMHYKRLRANTAEDTYINYLRPRQKHESTKAYVLYLLATDGRMYSSVNKLYLTYAARKCNFDKTLNFAEDTKFVLDYLSHVRGDINFILEPLYIYNFGTESSTINRTSTSWANWQTAYQNLKTWLGPHPSLRQKFWLHLVHLRWRISFVRSKRRAK
jgi:glycosyltransferase involved in cell wall biosynthesis/putative flippase GtrA